MKIEKPAEENYNQPSHAQKLQMYLGFLLYLAREYDRSGDHSASEVLMSEAHKLEQRLAVLETSDPDARS
jgi:hypothetical protein